MKEYFQPADPTILAETPQIPALSAVNLQDGLYLISLIDIEILALNIFDNRSKNISQPADPTILPETPKTPALSEAHLLE
jgi:hypothetical protein